MRSSSPQGKEMMSKEKTTEHTKFVYLVHCMHYEEHEASGTRNFGVSCSGVLLQQNRPENAKDILGLVGLSTGKNLGMNLSSLDTERIQGKGSSILVADITTVKHQGFKLKIS